ncbi:FMN-dependent dehydrogenase-domain-containing protein [Sporodiniella umbellata]|nr:FMN-dependent dehydrogenase-domain-containing protein [Sporodiniella umbellata]
MKTLSIDEVQQHNHKDDVWVIIHGKVYDLTKFLPEHPGGQKIILKYAGKDATKAFEPIHPPDIMQRFLPAEAFKGKLEDTTVVVDRETIEERHIAEARRNLPKLREMYNAFDFEAAAKSILPPQAWAYFSSGSNDEITLRENHNAFHRIWFRPRVMIDVKNVDCSTTMLGSYSSLPLYISATALGKLGHPEGELVLTQACKKTNVIQMISNFSSCSLDELVDAKGDQQAQWLQLYMNSDREVSKDLICHAEKRGIKGLFVTADTPQLGRREKDMRQTYLKNVSEEDSDDDDDDEENHGATQALTSFVDSSLCWDDIAWLKSITNMPILIKGVQTAEDAVLAAKYGCQGIVLSNHGGRQLDFSPSPIEILPEAIAALKKEKIGKEFEVYIDGGIRRGSDVFKAIALGAKGVGIGRPSLYAMSSYGVKGVERLLNLFQAEFEMVMRLMGVTSIDQIKPEMLDIRNLNNRFVSTTQDHLSEAVYDPMRPATRFSKI